MSIADTVIYVTHRMKGSVNMLSEAVMAREKLFVPGCHVQLTEMMNDPYNPLPKGLKGVVRHVDDLGTVHINWGNGSTLGAVLEDKIELR